MKKLISRRRFLTQTTAIGGVTLIGTAAAQALAGEGGTPARDVREDDDAPTEAEPSEMAPPPPNYEEIVRLPVYKVQVEPHWFPDSKRFWYRNNGPQGKREFLLVDAVAGTRRPAFDHAKLAAGLSQAAGKPYTADHLPFDGIVYTDDEKAVRFHTEGKDWHCDLATFACTPLPDGTVPLIPAGPVGGRRGPRGGNPPGPSRAEPVAPDGSEAAFVRDHNIWIRGRGDNTEKPLTKDGTAERPYIRPHWSPDSKALVAFRVQPVPIKPVYLIESSPRDNGSRGVLHQHEYAQPGDPFPVHEPWVFDAASEGGKAVASDPIEFGEDPPEPTWCADGSAFFYEQVERGHQRFRILRVDARTGQARPIVDERSKTFIATWNSYTYYTKNGAEVLYVSEQDGWRHLYLYDGEKGGLKNQITKGEWVVRTVDRVDEEKRQIWFQASGRNPKENPYHLHFYRINFDGTGLVELTDGDGSHTVQYSPDRTYLIDTYSRPDLPPVHTLRRVADGALVCPLETADISALTAAGWRAPEVFSAKGRDGKTDIWGLVFRPFAFDPKKKYPVIENIYAGPQDSFVRQRFSVGDGMQSLAELGFVVVQCDGMGTRNRSKAFHDVCWRNLKDAGFPDRIAWIKAIAAKYPYVDATRVGIYGTSAGGQNSTGALLFHPEFYKVAVSSCGCHDNRIDKRWWNEQWMGYPIGPWYEESSNITHAANLRGKLMLFVGELDTNVPPESTIRLTDALIKAEKDFDFVIITGSDHTGGGAYGERRRRDYFVRHLLGVEPPDRNAPKPAAAPITLHPRSLDEITLAQSQAGADTTIDFRNRTGGDIQLFWLSGNGQRTSYGTVAPGASHLLHTYSGHYWLITNKEGRPLALYIGETAPGIAEVHD